jgi:hypothetical protein
LVSFPCRSETAIQLDGSLHLFMGSAHESHGEIGHVKRIRGVIGATGRGNSKGSDALLAKVLELLAKILTIDGGKCQYPAMR